MIHPNNYISIEDNNRLGSVLEIDIFPPERKRVSNYRLWLLLFSISVVYCLLMLLILGFLLLFFVVVHNDIPKLNYLALTFIALLFQAILLVAFFLATHRKQKLLIEYDIEYLTTVNINLEKVIILDRGFYLIRFITDLSHILYLFKDIDYKIVCNYRDIISVSITIGSLIGKITTGNNNAIQGADRLLFTYTFKDKREIHVISPKLATKVLNQTESHYWTEIKAKIDRREIVSFGTVQVHPNYIYLGKRNFLISEVMEVAITQYSFSQSDSDIQDWVFEIRPRSEFRGKWFGISRYGLLPQIQDKTREKLDHIQNTHLLLKALTMLNIPISLDALENICPDEIVNLIKKYSTLERKF